MPWTIDNPPSVAKNWTPNEKQKCIEAANNVLSNNGNETDAIFACISAAGKSKKHDGDVMDLVTEIFSVGKWNGLEFKLSDLKDIVSNFDRLKDVQDVPLKFGHNDDQPFTDGQPALGWVDNVWLEGSKLMAKFTDMPKIVYEAIKKKLYKNVSIELLFDVEHKGQYYTNVLDAVALLGADIPAVNNLAELTTYMTRNALAARHTKKFSSINHSNQRKINMDELEKLTKQVSQLTESVNAQGEALKKVTEEKETFKRENEELKKTIELQESEKSKVSINSKREEIKTMFDRAIEAKVMTPAQRESQFKLLNIDNDDAVKAIDPELIKGMISSFGKIDFSNESGRAKPNNEESERKHKDINDEIDYRTKKLMTKSESKLTYSQAMIKILEDDKELAEEYYGVEQEAE